MSHTYKIYSVAVHELESQQPLSYEQVIDRFEREETLIVDAFIDDVEDEDGLRPTAHDILIERLRACVEHATSEAEKAAFQARLDELLSGDIY